MNKDPSTLSGTSSGDVPSIWDIPPYINWIKSAREEARRSAAWRTGDAAVANDIAQETIIIATSRGINFFQLPDRRQSFINYCRTVAFNKIREYWRNKTRERAILDNLVLMLSSDDRPLYSCEQVAALMDCVAALTPEEKECVAMRYFAGKKVGYKTIAQRLSCKSYKVPRILAKAYAQLRDCLNGNEDFHGTF